MPHPILSADYSISVQPIAYRPPVIPIQQPEPPLEITPPERDTIYSGATDRRQYSGLYRAIMGHSTLPSPKRFVFAPEPDSQRIQPIVVEDGRLNLDPNRMAMRQLANPVCVQRVCNEHAVWPRAVRNAALRIVAHTSDEPAVVTRHWCLKYFASLRQ